MISPKLIGKSYLSLKDELLNFMLRDRTAIGLVGPSGTGKTVLATEIAKDYAEANNIGAVYLQLHPEMTRTMSLGGETLEDGTVVIREKYIARACKKGLPIVVDEAAHTTEQMLLQFNSLVAEPFSFELGGEIHNVHKRTRFIFCCNPASTHLGNIPIPQSLACRLRIVSVDYPSVDEEIEIVKSFCPNTPHSLIKYVVSFFSKVRNEYYPLTVRNAVMVINSLDNIKGARSSLDSSLKKAIENRCKSEFNFTENELIEFTEEVLSFFNPDDFRRVVKECSMVNASLPDMIKDVHFIRQRIESTCL